MTFVRCRRWRSPARLQQSSACSFPTFRGGGGLPAGTRPDPRAMLGSPLYWAGLGLMAVAALLLVL